MSLIDRYRAAFRADPEAVARWESGEAFEVITTSPSGKVCCALPTCAGEGYGPTGGPDQPFPWQHAHLLGHSPCDKGCGRHFPVRWDKAPRTHGTHAKSCTGGLQ